MTNAELAKAVREREQAIFRALTTGDGKILRDYLGAKWFTGRTTVARPSVSAAVDIHETLLNEGSRRVVIDLDGIVERAKRPAPEVQTHAVSQSVERKEPQA